MPFFDPLRPRKVEAHPGPGSRRQVLQHSVRLGNYEVFIRRLFMPKLPKPSKSDRQPKWKKLQVLRSVRQKRCTSHPSRGIYKQGTVIREIGLSYSSPVIAGNKTHRTRPSPPEQRKPNRSCEGRISEGALHPSAGALFQICQSPWVFHLLSSVFSSSGDQIGHVSFSVPLGCRRQRRCHGMFRQNFRGSFIWRFPAVTTPYRRRGVRNPECVNWEHHVYGGLSWLFS